ncbi:MAG: hypothetical protein KDE56_03300, partial [Anaerolineales bacterium]|nr:hypothetical protein [Anaerolineales bacterium]
SGWRVQLVNDQDLEILTWLGRSAEALNQARTRSNPTTTYDGLWTIYTTLQKQNQPRSHLLPELEATARRCLDENERAEALATIAHEYLKHGNFDIADQLIQSIPLTMWQLIAQADLLRRRWQQNGRLPIDHDLLRLAAQIEQLREPISRLSATATLAVVFHEIGRRPLAHQYLTRCADQISAIPLPTDQLIVWLSVGEAWNEIGQHDERDACLEAAFAAAKLIEIDQIRDFMLSELVKRILPYQVEPMITQIQAEIEPPWLRATVDCQRISYAAGQGGGERAHRLLATLQTTIADWEPKERERLAAPLAQTLITLGQIETAEATIRQLAQPEAQLAGWRTLALSLAQQQHFDQAQEAFLQLRTRLEQGEDETQFTAVLTQVAAQLVKAGRPRQAETVFAWAADWSHKQADSLERTNNLNQLLTVYLDIGWEEQALTLIYQPEKPKDEHLATYTRYLIAQGRLSDAHELLHKRFSVANSTAAKLWSELGQAWLQQGEMAQAQAVFGCLQASCTTLIEILHASVGNEVTRRNIDPLCGRLKGYQIALDCALAVTQPAQATTHYDRATKLWATIASPIMRMAALGQLTACHIQLGKETDALSETAVTLLHTIPDPLDQEEALHLYTKPLLEHGYWAHVEQYLALVADIPQAKTRQTLATAFLTNNDLPKAQAILATITDTEVQHQLAPLLAHHWLRHHAPARAFSQLGIRSPNDFLLHLARWGDAWVAYPQNVSATTILTTATKILGWNSQDWQKLHALLA